ncbi:zinc ribbon domain-containing protein [Corallococcus sp. AB011P]|uniref:zinc ribbon domain-containing protein n=1 Tax=Corallococcus sp. AB011P TaxID=2316735 RepID=UPI000EA24925|nr:zinc ribbon domain-containing protein [Corallococcus sp. AB011P]RKG60871.1 zinc ribbon domain-containing protein [Corallococcus sp. AB011P]
MHHVYLLIQEMNAFDLPPVCIITGERQGVVFKPVKFSWYPPWISLFLLLGVLALALVPILPIASIVLPIALIVASVRTKQAKGTLPFTEEAWSRWRRARVIRPIAFAAGAGLLIMAAAVLAAGERMPLGLGALALGVALPVLAWVYSSQGPQLVGSDKDALEFASFLSLRVPQLPGSREDALVLSIPSSAAAQAIMSHFEAGLQVPSWEGEEPLAADGAPATPRCARHDGFVANKVCQRCGTFMCPHCEYRVRRESQSFCPSCCELRARSIGQGPVYGLTAPGMLVAGVVVLTALGFALLVWRTRH